MPDPHLVKCKFPERGLDSGGYNAMSLSQRFERQRTCVSYGLDMGQAEDQVIVRLLFSNRNHSCPQKF